ncbi:MAG: RsmE family RNA methyltransferase [Alphaproteobacteria bacterium]|nr:RsmE family RNA methyltransferase [Alphaproteobacteria bacterium]
MAHRPRVFCLEKLVVGGAVSLAADRAHHLATVLRLRVGESLSLFNPTDGEFLATIVALGKRTAEVSIQSQLVSAAADPATSAGRPLISLFFAAVKREAMDGIVEKGTELGVAAFYPILTDHCVATRVGVERLRAIAIAASEQSGRISVPMIAEPKPLAAILHGWKNERGATPLLACCEAGATLPLITCLASLRHPTEIGIVIGPEGGFSPAELTTFTQLDFVLRASLGPTILRSETAAIAAVATVMNNTRMPRVFSTFTEAFNCDSKD